MAIKIRGCFWLIGVLVILGGCATSPKKQLEACTTIVDEGFRPVAQARDQRFEGKVQENTALCSGGNKAVAYRKPPLGRLAELLGHG